MSDPCETCGYDWLEGDAMSYTIDQLRQEIALARASSDYWRAKYIAMNEGSKEYVNSTRNALYWYNASLQNASPFMRSPMDECDE